MFKKIDWYIEPSSKTNGFTQTSRTKIEGQDEIAYFSHPFDFELYYLNEEINTKYIGN